MAITQWIRLHLPFCGPGFESQAHHLRFDSKILCYICHCMERRDENVLQIFEEKAVELAIAVAVCLLR